MIEPITWLAIGDTSVVVAGDDARDPRVSAGTAGSLRTTRRLRSRGGHHVAAGRIDREVDVGQHAAEGARARDRDLTARRVGQPAVVGGVRVAADHEVHRVVAAARRCARSPSRRGCRRSR